MKNFTDISALRGTLRNVYQKFPSEPEQRLSTFAAILENQLDFTKEDAALYASTALTRNAEGSSDWVSSSALNIVGTWMRMSQAGMPSALLKSETETWHFSEELTCEHKLDSYEGYVSPFGSSYSVPSSNSQFFAWACSDLKSEDLKVVIVSPNGGSGVLTFVFLDTQIFPHKCSINGNTFLKQ